MGAAFCVAPVVHLVLSEFGVHPLAHPWAPLGGRWAFSVAARSALGGGPEMCIMLSGPPQPPRPKRVRPASTETASGPWSGWRRWLADPLVDAEQRGTQIHG